MENKQVQKAGDNSQQVQAINSTIVMGIDEKRVREVCSEIAIETIKQCTQEASAIAIKRIEKFTTDLIPRVEKIENDFKSFSDPSFQFELRNAQKVASCTDRESDYELLSELLVHRIEKNDERKTKASISKAIEIVNQIDDDALCSLTLLYAILNRWTATTGKISEGLSVMNDFFSSICYQELPNNLDWLYHLDILNAARIFSVEKFKMFNEFYPKWFEGYTCIGIKKDSEIFQSAIEILQHASLPNNLLIDHELNNGYVRLAVRSKNEIENIILTVLMKNNEIESRKLSESEIDALNKIWNLYSNESKIKEDIKNAFMKKWDTYNTLKSVRLWWESLPYAISITPIGQVLAHANAQKRYKHIPQIKF